jgi:alkanesulfonate monooxygenase SsuD/methylene tetrahydromethanopterin reductase-like flavin-dependent oxidoreductase (luciferase family)
LTRGFGIDAGVPTAVALEVAKLAEQSGYGSFWVNGSPHDGALTIVESVLDETGLDVGVGVFPLPKIGAEQLVAEMRSRSLPQSRLWLGVGSGRRPGALAEVRSAARLFREELDVHVVTGAVGPKMMALAGEVADAVILTWSFADEVRSARVILERSASESGRESPPVISFIRCGLLPQAAHAVEERVKVYEGIPHYRAVFDRHGVTARETVVTGANRHELEAGIQREEAVLDMPVIRAIPSEDTVEALGELVAACAP